MGSLPFRRDGDERRFPDADDDVPQQKLVVVVSDGAEQGCAAPDERSCGHDPLAGVAVGKPSYRRGSHHVTDEECRGEKADLRVIDVEFFLDERLHCIEHVAIDVVQEVQRREQQQSGDRAFPCRHRWAEDNTAHSG